MERYRFALLWQLVWGLPQTLVGLGFRMALRGTRQRHAFRAALVCEWGLESGLSLGPFIFVPRDCPHSLVLHEYGHTLQSLLLGPLYLPLIVLPSLVWAGVPACQRFRVRRGYSYYRFLPESWANKLVRRTTGEKPIGWYD